MRSIDTQANRERVHSRIGDVCIFREKGLILPVVLESATTDSWGVKLNLQPTERRGFSSPPQGPFRVGFAWGYGSITADRVTCAAQGATWALYFDQELIRSLENLASTVDPSERWEQLTAHIDELELRRLRGGADRGPRKPC